MNDMKAGTVNASEFQKIMKVFYTENKRDLPWRQPEPNGSFDPYKILVSEIMLQQTQVPRVIPKYYEFLQWFPTTQKLASASLGDVLRVWNGLGYNRRARYLHEAAKQLQSAPPPWQYDQLIACKGIGPNTAAAVLVYSYDEPINFVETNIRSVIIHHFFGTEKMVPDKEILALLQVIKPENVSHRSFYWALMDYGTYLKQTVGNTARRSKHYVRQSPFVGSNRQLRGQLLRLLGERPQSMKSLNKQIADSRLAVTLDTLCQEGLVVRQDSTYRLP